MYKGNIEKFINDAVLMDLDVYYSDKFLIPDFLMTIMSLLNIKFDIFEQLLGLVKITSSYVRITSGCNFAQDSLLLREDGRSKSHRFVKREY